jgi:hypothetical protein
MPYALAFFEWLRCTALHGQPIGEVSSGFKRKRAVFTRAWLLGSHLGTIQFKHKSIGPWKC